MTLPDSQIVIGHRVWYSDGAVLTDPWEELPDDGILIKMLYFKDGTKEIQHGLDFYYEAPHPSGGIIRGAGMKEDQIVDRYPGAIIKRGIWSPNEFYHKAVEEAMASNGNVFSRG